MNLQNLIDYGQDFNIDVLAGVQVAAPLDLERMKSHIVFRCGLLTPLYSEPTTMRDAIAHWFSYMAYGISKMLELAQTEYLPLENYRRTESESRSGNDAGTLGRVSGETVDDSGTISDDFDGTITDEVSAYNSSTYEPGNKRTVDQTNEREIDTTRETNGTVSENRTGQYSENVSRLLYGNIGTMTTQEMFNEELDLLARFNPYDWIVDRLERDLFLGLW